ncbi:MAG: hypothetical protein Q9219_006136 [cf. Caloplaca sp. 3 TL-2023]
MSVRILIIGAVFSVFAVTAVSGRIWARRIRNVDLQLSDKLAVAALLFTLGLNATIMVAAISGVVLLKTSKKIALTFIFGLGALVCIISVLRVVAIHELDPLDLSYTSAADGIWSILEPSLGIVAACLPIMQPVLSRLTEYTATLFSRNKGTSQRTLRASSKQMPDHDERPLNDRNRDIEDRLYPMSDFTEAFHGGETEYPSSNTEATTLEGIQDLGNNRHMITKTSEYTVRSDPRV